tara:strand:+ start:59 stop:415 length:357 start_codon:yes stop_codon:yes gene_type:complete
MAEVIKILGNAKLTGSYVSVYTVPKMIGSDNAVGPIPQAIVGSIVLCETAGSSANIDIRIVPRGDVEGGQHNIFDTLPMSGRETKIISPGITISSEDKITAKASTTDVNIFIFGSELA